VKAEVVENECESTSYIDFDNLDTDGLNREGEKHGFDFEACLRGIISGNWDISLESIKATVSNIFFEEIKNGCGYVKSILLICVVMGIFSCISGDIRGEEVRKSVFFVGSAAVMGALVTAYGECVGIVTNTVGEITDIIRAGIPLIITLVSAGGDIDLFSPVLFTVTDASVTIITKFLLPVIMFAFTIRILNCLTEKRMLSKLCDLLVFIVTNGLKLLSGGFMLWLSFERISSETAGSLLTNTAVSAVKMIPVVGSVFSGGTDIIMGSIAAVKNGAALAAIVLIVIAAFVPIIKIAVISLLYRFAAAVIEPLGEKGITDMIDGFGQIVWLLSGTLFTVTFMYTASVVIMLCSV
jgi:stage III sporulation protein AE